MENNKPELIETKSVVMPSWGKCLLALVICLSVSAATRPAMAQGTLLGNAIENYGYFLMEGTTDVDPESGEYEYPFIGGGDVTYQLPLDETASPWQLPPEPDSGMWVYANRAGRVRTYAETGSDLATSQFGFARLFWQGHYIRSDDIDPVSVVNHSFLELFADHEGPWNLYNRAGIQTPPFARMSIEIEVCGAIAGNMTNLCVTVFKHESHIEGIRDHSNFPMRVVKSETRRFFGPDEKAYTVETPGFLRHEILATEVKLGVADFWAIDIGEPYTVQYWLEVEVGQDADEHMAKAILGDPLDADIGGITLNTTHTAVARDVHICEQVPDPNRFSVHGDGTVTDLYSGLMWQRCPLDYTLNENGTPANLSDDLCTPDTTVTHDWQSALQSAANDSSAAYTDWQLPNVKQLESLVDLSCYAPTIDMQSFPDTPAAPFWTSTPAANAEQAWEVHFSGGDVSPTDKAETQQVRLVRNSGTTPVIPGAAIVAGNASVIEGDSGTTAMDFRIELTRPVATDVSVDYATQAINATEIDDYVAGSGSLIIPAGEVAGTVSIMVNGDTAAEDNELFWLTLSNVSAGAYLAKAASIGVIIDDEPKISVAAAMSELIEGDSGAQDYEFIVSLDRPAVAAINVDYATSDVTATAGTDYVATSGTVTINSGEDTASVLVPVNGDVLVENDETFQLLLSNVVGGASLSNPVAIATIRDDDGGGSYAALNDTGTTTCTNLTSTLLTCPQVGFPMQDGELGRDVTDNDPSDGMAGFSFTKLDADGVPLTNQAATYPYVNIPSNPSQELWACVVDEVTGFTWEIPTDVPGDLRNYAWTYSWYNSSGGNDGGNVGAANGGVCVDGVNCDTEKYVAAVNAMNLCGYSDWRLPGEDELFTLAIIAPPGSGVLRGLDPNYFPHNYSTNGNSNNGYTYWSSTPSASEPASAWTVHFQSPYPVQSRQTKTVPASIQLVRGGS